MKIININNREKKEGKERRKKTTDLFSLVCEIVSWNGLTPHRPHKSNFGGAVSLPYTQYDTGLM
jgi:hypothetical protein